jgi:hypothetical protein
MPLRRLAVPALLALVLATGCSSGPPSQDLSDALPGSDPMTLACEETVTGFFDHAPDAAGATLGEALVEHVGDDSVVEVVDHTGSHAVAVVRRDDEVVAVIRASRSRGGWLVDEVERCIDP